MLKNDFFELMVITFCVLENKNIKDNGVYNAYVSAHFPSICLDIYNRYSDQFKKSIEYTIIENKEGYIFDMQAYNDGLQHIKNKYKRNIRYCPKKQGICISFTGFEVEESLKNYSKKDIINTTNFCNLINYIEKILKLTVYEIKLDNGKQKTLS